MIGDRAKERLEGRLGRLPSGRIECKQEDEGEQTDDSDLDDPAPPRPPLPHQDGERQTGRNEQAKHLGQTGKGQTQGRANPRGKPRRRETTR